MPTTVREQVLEVAAQRRGIRYKMPPDPTGVANLDCSLYVVLTLRDAGVPLPRGVRTAEQIRQACVPIDLSEVEAGDVLFFEHTFEPDGDPGPDGRIASHVGIAVDATRRRMWDCHASNENTDLPGVGVTDITTSFWAPKLFEARRAPRLTDDDGTMHREPLRNSSSARYRTIDGGVRLRASPGTSAPILIHDLGEGTILTAVDDQDVERDGHQWRHLRAPDETVGWAAATFLELLEGERMVPPPPPPPPPVRRFRVTSDALRVRDQPSLQSTTLDALPQGAIVSAVEDATVEADEIVWRHVRTDGGVVGWMSSRFLERVPDGD